MLPNFLLIGTQKAATTWLAKCLVEHPDVYIPEIKEIYYFGTHFQKGIEWYESQFSGWKGQLKIGDATTGYIANPHAPERIMSALGKEVKFIASLRHPIDRAYSAFWMHLSRGRIPLDTDFRSFFRRDDQFMLREFGFYHMHLSRYMKFFPKESFLILIYEEMKNNEQEALEKCFNFLEIDTNFQPKSLTSKLNKGIPVSSFYNPIWKIREVMKRLPRAVERPIAAFGRLIFEKLPKQKRYQPLNESVREELLEEFKPDIIMLEKLLCRDLSIWSSPDSQKASDSRPAK